MKSIISCLCTSLTILGLSACSSDTTEIGSVHVKSELVKAAQGGTIEIVPADVPEHADLVGAKIEIPAGALSADTTITLGLEKSNVPEGATAAGPVIDFGPNGTVFRHPATITLPYDGATSRDLIRIYVRQADGRESVIMPSSIVLDPSARRLRFTVSHFTSFQPVAAGDACANVDDCASNQCQNGRCVDPNACDPTNCGPAPGIPSWTCEDGSIGGFTGLCGPLADGSCGWIINNCEPANNACDASHCGPPPSVPSYTCPDGSIGGFTGQCAPDANGQCHWVIDDCYAACTDATACAPGEICQNGVCHPGSPPPCNADGQCPAGEICDPTTGRCSSNNGTLCDQSDCGPAPGLPSYVCADGSIGGFTGRCIPSPDGQCGWEIRSCDPAEPCTDASNNVGCPAGEICDASLGRCVPAGCTDPTNCATCSADSDCGANQVCVNGVCSGSNQTCDAALCGPPLGAPAYTCEDGTIGGNTGRCLADPNGQCGWEYISCPAAQPCDAANASCNAGYVCVDGLCLRSDNTNPACSADSDCGPNEVCVNGVCGG